MMTVQIQALTPVGELRRMSMERVRRFLLWHGGPEHRGRRYLLTACAGLFVIWGLSLGVLAFWPRSFTSEMTLILPGAGSTSAVSLERIGQATASSASPFGFSGISPTVNYKEILESRRVLTLTAARLDMPRDTLAKPRAKVTDQTQLIAVSMNGPSPEEAQRRLDALLASFQSELDRLRRDEVAVREANYRVMLASFQSNLEQIRNRILDHQSQSGLVSVDQFNQLVQIIEQLAKQASEVSASRQQKAGEAEQLAASLGIDPRGAADALALQSDPVFQGYLKAYAESSQKLSENLTKWGEGHPAVLAEKGRRDAAQGEMRARARKMLGRRDDAVLRFLESEASRNQAELLQRLVAVVAEEAGYGRQTAELERRVVELRERIALRTNDAARLEDLFRDLQLAEAVFRSALGRIDTGKTDLFSSYPLVQTLETPILPDRRSSPSTLLVLAGAVFGTLFFLLGLGLLWIRMPFLTVLLKND